MGEKRRGRPRGPSEHGERAREEIFHAAVAMFAEEGFEGTTMRALAKRVGVSPGLAYRYFPSKAALVLELYRRLTAELLERTRAMPKGRWRKRATFVLDESLAVLAPHREALRGLLPVQLSAADGGIFTDSNAASRLRVEGEFMRAVIGAKDAPAGETAVALGRALYLLHLGVVLWWLLDVSPRQRATRGLTVLVASALRFAGLALRLPGARHFLDRLDGLIRDGLYGERSEATG